MASAKSGTIVRQRSSDLIAVLIVRADDGGTEISLLRVHNLANMHTLICVFNWTIITDSYMRDAGLNGAHPQSGNRAKNIVMSN